jgi:hypothetical protein
MSTAAAQPLNPREDPVYVPDRLLKACAPCPARTRLEEAVGRDFARLLVAALSSGLYGRDELSA